MSLNQAQTLETTLDALQPSSREKVLEISQKVIDQFTALDDENAIINIVKEKIYTLYLKGENTIRLISSDRSGLKIDESRKVFFNLDYVANTVKLLWGTLSKIDPVEQQEFADFMDERRREFAYKSFAAGQSAANTFVGPGAAHRSPDTGALYR